MFSNINNNASGSAGTSNGFLFGSNTGNTMGGASSGGFSSKPLTLGSSNSVTGGGLFGQQQGQQQQQPAQTGGLFGSKPATGGLFGQQQQAQPAQTGGLFGQQGQQQQQQPAPAGGLFGSKPATGGLFGQQQAQPAQTGGLFGSKPATGGLFGQQQAQPAQTGGLFGQQGQQQGQQQQPAQAPPAQNNIFGKTNQPSFAWSENSAHLQQQQQHQSNLLQQQQQQQLQQQQQQQQRVQQQQTNGSIQYSTNYPQQIQEQLIKLQQQWLPLNDDCKFKGFVYNKLDDVSNNGLVVDLQKPNDLITQNEWEQALKNRTSNEYIPVLLSSPTNLQERIILQMKTVAQYRQIMNNVIYEEHLSQLKDKHNLDTNIRLAKCQTKLRDLDSRLWKLNCTLKTILEQTQNYKFQINPDVLLEDNNGVVAAVNGDEDEDSMGTTAVSNNVFAHNKHYQQTMFGMSSSSRQGELPLDEVVSQLVKQSEDPSSLGKVQSGELWARLSMLKERCKFVIEKLDGKLGTQQQQQQKDTHDSEGIADEDKSNPDGEENDTNIDDKITSVLNIQQDGMLYLNKILTQDLESLKNLSV